MLNSESFHASSTNKAWLSSRKKGNLSLFPCLVNECPYISISLDIVPCLPMSIQNVAARTDGYRCTHNIG